LKKLSVLFLVIASFACAAENEGLDELKRLCEKDAGLKIYKTVEADGYYNAYSESGWGDALIKGPYQFYEYCDDSPSLSKAALIPEPGCYRLRKVHRKEGQCHQRIDEKLSTFVVAPYPKFLEEFCIEVQKIENPTAIYSFHSESKSWSDKNGVSEFRRSHVFVKDRLSSETLGEYISYSYNEKPRHTSPKSCNIINKQIPSFVDAKLVESTIITHQGEMK